MAKKNKPEPGGTAEGFLRGLGDILEKLGQLAETGERLKRTGAFEIRSTGDADQPLKGVYGFSVKVGLGERETKVEPFGNIRRDVQSGETVVHAVTEPMVDVIEEADHIRVVAEMPGVEEGDIHLEVDGDLLTIQAERGAKKYHKEVLLPRAVASGKPSYSCRNGILEVRIE